MRARPRDARRCPGHTDHELTPARRRLARLIAATTGGLAVVTAAGLTLAAPAAGAPSDTPTSTTTTATTTPAPPGGSPTSPQTPGAPPSSAPTSSTPTASTPTASTPTASTPTASTPTTATPPTAAPANRVVSYDGYHVTVPASWPVYDLGHTPTTCVRTDVSAVYLGHPGPDQQCPAHAVGHAPTLLIEPYDTTARSHVTPAAQRTAAGDGTGQLQVLSADHAVMVTATYASSAAGGSSDGSAADPAPGSATPGSTTPASPPALSGRAAAEALLAGGTALSATPPLPTTPADPAATTTGPAGAGPDTVYQEGTLGFDTCAAPSVNTMAAWRASPYRTVGVYIGGINRACGYGNLSSGWLQTVRSYGYGFIPTYVGPQAPCSGIGEPMPTDPSAVTTLATQNAYGAVLDMRAFGLGQGNPVYFDLEYFHGDATCHATVVRYFDAWTRELHRRGYLSAVYSSSSSLADFVAHYNDSSFARPDALWMASWNGSHSVYGNSTVPDSQWNPHRRIHQYSGGEYHTYGGYTLNIDGDYADAPVGAPGTQTGTPPPTPLNATSLAGATLLGPGAASSGPGHLAVVTRGSNGQVYYRYASGNVWSAWALALPGVPSSNPGVISWGGSQLHIFARDRRNHLIQAWQDGGPIQGWQNLGGCLRSGPGVAMSGPGTAYVTVRGCNNHVYLKEYLGHGWSRWFDLGGSVTSAPAVITWRNHLQVFARGVHGRLWSRWENYGRWSRWALVNGGQVLGGPAAASIGPGKTDVYIRSRRGYLYNLSQRPGQGWSGWHATNVYATSDAAVSTNGSHRNDVFYRGSAGDVQHRWYAR